MPQVPRYDSPQVGAAVQSGAGVTAPTPPDITNNATLNASRALGQAGDQITKAALDMQAEVNQSRINDAMNQAIRARTDLQVQALQLQGRNALERPDGKPLTDEFGEKLDKSVSDIADGLGNDEQKRVFGQATRELRNQFYGSLSTHMLQQQRAFQKETQGATIQTATNQAALLWGDASMREQSRGAIAATVDEMAKTEGWDDKIKQAKLTEFMSPMHLGVMKGMLSGGVADQADAYYKANSADMTVPARAMAQDMLKGQVALQKAQAFADQALAGGMSMPDALAQAREKFTGEEEERTVAEVKTRFAEREAGRAQVAKEVSRSAWSVLMEKGSMGAIPPDTMAALRKDAPEEERQMRDWLEAKWRRAKADAEGKSFDAGFDKFYSLRRMAMDDPQAFSSLDLRKFEPYLAKSQLTNLVDIQSGIAKGDAKAMDSQRVIKQTLEMIKPEVAAIGIDLTPKEGTPEAKKTAEFMGTLTQALDDATRSKGAPLTGDEARRIGMTMVQQGVLQGSGVFGVFQTKRYGYEIATKGQPGENYVAKRFGDIPPTVRDKLAAEYRQAKGLGTRALTAEDEAAIERAYTRGVQTGRIK